MAQKLFEVEGGYSDGVIHYLSGTGAPGGDAGYQDAAPVGSFYTDVSGNVTHYKKTSAGAGNDKWSLQVASEKLFQAVNQVGHGLAVGDLVRRTASGYVKAQADTADNADVVGIVEAVSDVDNFTLVTSGLTDVTTAEADGTPLFLSPTIAGGITATKPTSGVQKHVGFAVAGKVLLQIGMSIEIASTEAPFVPLFVTTGVTTAQTVASVSVGDTDTVLWQVVVDDALTGGRYSSIISASHNGFTADASVADFQEFAILEMGAALTGLSIGVSLAGTGPTQTMELVVAASSSSDVKVRQIKA